MDRHTYTVETDTHQCGHQHRTARAAARCRVRLWAKDSQRFYGATIRKDGQRANGIGLWADGEAAP